MKIVDEVRKCLKESADEKTKTSFQRFFKEKVKCHGVKSATVGKIGKEYFEKIKDENKENIFGYSEDLLKSGYCEEAWIGAGWVDQIRSKFEGDDIKIFEKWIDKYIDNWAKCDTFCNHTVGSYIEKYTKKIAELKGWAKSRNLWLRRAAAVSLIIPAKDGEFLKDILEIADILLEDKEDMVQKGYGWLLKEASRKHQKEVFDYVMKNKEKMPRTALRYAIEKMPEGLKKVAREK